MEGRTEGRIQNLHQTRQVFPWLVLKLGQGKKEGRSKRKIEKEGEREGGKTKGGGGERRERGGDRKGRRTGGWRK
jgi:hypothetical protein